MGEINIADLRVAEKKLKQQLGETMGTDRDMYANQPEAGVFLYENVSKKGLVYLKGVLRRDEVLGLLEKCTGDLSIALFDSREGAKTAMHGSITPKREAVRKDGVSPREARMSASTNPVDGPSVEVDVP